MMDAAYERCTAILSEHEDQLHIIAKLLYEKETVEAEEFLDVMNGRTLPGPAEETVIIDAENASSENPAAPDEEIAAEETTVTEIPNNENNEEGVSADEIKAETVETTGTDDSDEKQ